MDFDAIFEAYYTQYRAVETIPTTTDAEYTIGMRLANEAISRWENYDNTFWQELYTTPQLEDESITIVTDQTQYDIPDNFKAAGGDIRILDTDGNTVRHYQLLSSEKPQFRNDQTQYAYFTGNPSSSYQLNLNPGPDSSISGDEIAFVYYKKASLFTTGTDISEIPNPYFVIHRMLANRFRASRNPYYSDALRDAEDALQMMKMVNDTGTWSNPLKVTDNSGTRWGM